MNMDLDIQSIAALAIFNEKPSFWVNVYNYLVLDHKIDKQLALQAIDAASGYISKVDTE
jgi:hypothetical protein